VKAQVKETDKQMTNSGPVSGVGKLPFFTDYLTTPRKNKKEQ